MSRTIKVWVVVDDGAITYGHYLTRQAAEEGIKRLGGTVVELTGELPDPPHVWKVGDWYVIEDQPGAYQIAAPAAGGLFYVLHHLDPRKHVRLLEYVSMNAKPANAIPCDPPVWFTEGGAS